MLRRIRMSSSTTYLRQQKPHLLPVLLESVSVVARVLCGDAQRVGRSARLLEQARGLEVVFGHGEVEGRVPVQILRARIGTVI